MFELFMFLLSPGGELRQFIESNNDLYAYVIKRAFEGSMVFYILIFIIFIALCYLIFRNFWRA